MNNRAGCKAQVPLLGCFATTNDKAPTQQSGVVMAGSLRYASGRRKDPRASNRVLTPVSAAEGCIMMPVTGSGTASLASLLQLETSF